MKQFLAAPPLFPAIPGATNDPMIYEHGTIDSAGINSCSAAPVKHMDAEGWKTFFFTNAA